jgi:hypothetical protein
VAPIAGAGAVLIVLGIFGRRRFRRAQVKQ